MLTSIFFNYYQHLINVISWMRRFPVHLFLNLFSLRLEIRGRGLPTNTTKIESPRILMIPQYLDNTLFERISGVKCRT